MYANVYAVSRKGYTFLQTIRLTQPTEIVNNNFNNVPSTLQIVSEPRQAASVDINSDPWHCRQYLEVL